MATISENDRIRFGSIISAIESRFGELTEATKSDLAARLTVAGATTEEIALIADAVRLEKSFPTGLNVVFLLKEIRDHNSRISRKVTAVKNCSEILDKIKGVDKWSF